MSIDVEHARILIVDDSPATLELLERQLSAGGHRVFSAPGVSEALAVLEQTPIDLVITDWKMPRISGLDLVRHVRENFKNTEVMMMTGFASIEGAVEAVKSGAQEYLSKPFTEEELFAAVQRALQRLRSQQAGSESDEAPAGAGYGLLGESAVMQAVYRVIPKAAGTTATVLITGESGTGKEMVARAIHYSSARASAAFVPVNCGGIPEALLESELFGHMKGAFTGASESRAGFFQTADGGTIFLDEISETSPAMQVKLLRVLQDNEVCMVGSARPHRVDVRVIAATNRELLELVRKNVFREDLYYRLNVLPIRLPPLRERGDDVLLLLRHFAAKIAAELGREPPQFSQRALEALRRHNWPGNVRELQNLVQRLVIMSEQETIDVIDLPPLMRFSLGGAERLDRTLAEVEAEHIRNVMSGTAGNKTRAAEILGIDRKTLRQKLRQYEIEEAK